MIKSQTELQKLALMQIQMIPAADIDYDSRDRRLLANMEFNLDQTDYILELIKKLNQQIEYDVSTASLEAMRLRLRDGCMDRIVENGRYFEDQGDATKLSLAVLQIGEYFFSKVDEINKHLRKLGQTSILN